MQWGQRQWLPLSFWCGPDNTCADWHRVNFKQPHQWGKDSKTPLVCGCVSKLNCLNWQASYRNMTDLQVKNIQWTTVEQIETRKATEWFQASGYSKLMVCEDLPSPRRGWMHSGKQSPAYFGTIPRTWLFLGVQIYPAQWEGKKQPPWIKDTQIKTLRKGRIIFPSCREHSN